MLRRKRRPFAGDSSVLSSRVANLVERHSGVGERPAACLRGRGDNTMVVYDDRVVIVRPRRLTAGLGGGRVTTLYLRDILGIHVSARVVNGYIEVTTPAVPRARTHDVERPRDRLPNCVPVRRRRLESYEPVLQELRTRIAAAKAPKPSIAPEQVLSELERLGALRLTGILSSDEFDRAKRLLLDTAEAA